MKLIFFAQGKVSYHLSENLYSSLIYSKKYVIVAKQYVGQNIRAI